MSGEEENVVLVELRYKVGTREKSLLERYTPILVVVWHRLMGPRPRGRTHFSPEGVAVASLGLQQF